MLAKIWKKLLLAICIIACIYNVMSKLVNRVSLEIQLNSVKNGSSFSELWNKDDDVNEKSSQKNTENDIDEDNNDSDDDTIVVVY